MRWRGGVLAVLMMAVGLAGCGGSHTLTKSQFIAKADPICAKATADSNALPQPQSPPELVSLAQKTAHIVESKGRQHDLLDRIVRWRYLAA